MYVCMFIVPSLVIPQFIIIRQLLPSTSQQPPLDAPNHGPNAILLPPFDLNYLTSDQNNVITSSTVSSNLNNHLLNNEIKQTSNLTQSAFPPLMNEPPPQQQQSLSQQVQTIQPTASQVTNLDQTQGAQGVPFQVPIHQQPSQSQQNTLRVQPTARMRVNSRVPPEDDEGERGEGMDMARDPASYSPGDGPFNMRQNAPFFD